MPLAASWPAPPPPFVSPQTPLDATYPGTGNRPAGCTAPSASLAESDSSTAAAMPASPASTLPLSPSFPSLCSSPDPLGGAFSFFLSFFLSFFPLRTLRSSPVPLWYNSLSSPTPTSKPSFSNYVLLIMVSTQPAEHLNHILNKRSKPLYARTSPRPYLRWRFRGSSRHTNAQARRRRHHPSRQAHLPPLPALALPGRNWFALPRRNRRAHPRRPKPPEECRGSPRRSC